MIVLDEVHAPATALFPCRVPEPAEAMTPTESAALAAWQQSPLGRAVYDGLAAHVVAALGPAPARVLCVAEGEGLLAARLAARLPGAAVVGTDLCPEVVGRARARHPAPNLRFEPASAYALGRLGPVDAVVCAFSFHHFSAPADALAQMRDVLAPGGRLYLMDLRRDADLGSYFRRLDDYVGVAPEVARLFRMSVNAAWTTAELSALLDATGGWARRSGGPVAFGAPGRGALAGALEPALVAASLRDIEGLWQEVVAVRGGRR